MNWLEFREPASAWSHLVWLWLAIPATWLLWRLARGDVLKRIGFLVFGFSLMFCASGSFLFHSAPVRFVRPFNTMDHIGIYLLIAGTVTPIALVILRGWWRIGLLAGLWGLALAGVVLRLTTVLAIPQLTLIYLAMGWVGGAVYFELARRLSHAAVRPIWIGGLFYSVGAVCNRIGWPDLIPGVFGAHEVFHLFVIAGSAWHYYFMLAVVAPYQEAPAADSVVNASAPQLSLGGRVLSEAGALPR